MDVKSQSDITVERLSQAQQKQMIRGILVALNMFDAKSIKAVDCIVVIRNITNASKGLAVAARDLAQASNP